jgi:uncharacterized protein (DUF433 family)
MSGDRVMITVPEAVALPLKTDEHGVIRISGTRVTLHTIIGFYLQGETPEEIRDGFPTVPLADVYAVISYYLAHRDELDAYFQKIEEEADALRREVESHYTPEQHARTEQWRKLVSKKHNDPDA